jgi:hypothetical protein
VLKDVFPELSVAGIKEWSKHQILLIYGQEIKELEKKAELSLGNYTVNQAHQEYSSRFGHVNLAEFNEILGQSGRLRIYNKKENGAVIYPKLLNRLNLLKGILEGSTKPLSSRNTYATFKRRIQRMAINTTPVFTGFILYSQRRQASFISAGLCLDWKSTYM